MRDDPGPEHAAARRARLMPTALTHKLLEIAEPVVAIQSLADAVAFDPQTAGRPIRKWARDPALARYLNEKLASGA